MPYEKVKTTETYTTKERIHFPPLPAREDIIREVTRTREVEKMGRVPPESLKETCLEFIAKTIRNDAGFFARQNIELPNELLGELNEEVKAQVEYNQQNR